VLVGLFIVRAIVIIVPFIMSLMLDVVLFLVLVFNPIMCILIADNVTQVSIILIPTALL
jgi:hypothetical protein